MSVCILYDLSVVVQNFTNDFLFLRRSRPFWEQDCRTARTRANVTAAIAQTDPH